MSRYRQGSLRPSRAASRNHHAKRKGDSGAVNTPPFTLDIDRLSHDGRGIGLNQGKTTFVEGALPDEQVIARLKSDHSRYSEAVTEKVLVSSPVRVEPLCEYFTVCGGCNLQHLDLPQQLAMKQQAVLDQLQRWAGLEPEVLLPPIESDPFCYRSRARLGVSYARDGSVTLGFRKSSSNQLLSIENCSILSPELNALISPFTQWLKHYGQNRPVTHIELIASDAVAAVVIRHTRKISEQGLTALVDLASDRGCEIWLQPDAKGGLYDLQGQPCSPRLEYTLMDGELTLEFHPQDFCQVNSLVNRKMVNQALTLLAPKATERVLDLFCGIGNFTLPLARLASEVVGVEAVDTMVERGRENAERNGIGNVSFVAADLEKDVSRQAWLKSGFDAVLLDPPRAGAKGVATFIEQVSPRRLVYVSCNPATFARDAKELSVKGYRLHTLGVMDMFPQTSHVESMGLFIKGCCQV